MTDARHCQPRTLTWALVSRVFIGIQSLGSFNICMIGLSYSDSGPRRSSWASMAQGRRHKNMLMKWEISRAQRHLWGASRGLVLLKTGLSEPRSAELPLHSPPGDNGMWPLLLFFFFLVFFQLYWGIIDKIIRYLKYTPWWFDILTHCAKIPTTLQPVRRRVERVLKKIKLELPYDPAIRAYIWRKTWSKRIHAPQCSL